MALLLVPIALLSGTRFVVDALAALAVGCALLGVAGCLLAVRRVVARRSVGLALLTVLLEGILLVCGRKSMALSSYTDAHTPTVAQGTHGPFADGEIGMLGLLGMAWFYGAWLVGVWIIGTRLARRVAP
jgi:hypothetical protein